jgi:glutamate 5-kinase
MSAYESIFKYYNYHVGQVLITHKGLDDTDRNETIRETIKNTFKLNLIPIINANDTVTSNEIVSGDNDSLAARVAGILCAKKLFILTDTSGLYNKDPNAHEDARLISKVHKVDDEILKIAGGSGSKLGTGGMRSKVEAGNYCINNNVEMIIMNSYDIIKIPELAQEYLSVGTKFTPIN